MATIEGVEQRMKASYNFKNPLDGAKYQMTVKDFMNLLHNGQLQKSKHNNLVDQFIV